MSAATFEWYAACGTRSSSCDVLAMQALTRVLRGSPAYCSLDVILAHGSSKSSISATPWSHGKNPTADGHWAPISIQLDRDPLSPISAADDVNATSPSRESSGATISHQRSCRVKVISRALRWPCLLYAFRWALEVIIPGSHRHLCSSSKKKTVVGSSLNGFGRHPRLTDLTCLWAS